MSHGYLDGYVLSSGLDQKVFLWEISGKCIGEFGMFGWDISNQATWIKNISFFSQLDKRRRNKVVSKRSKFQETKKTEELEYITPKPIDTSARAITKENLHLTQSPSTTIIKNIGIHQTHTSQEMNNYVESLNHKISNRPPTYVEINKSFDNLRVRI